MRSLLALSVAFLLMGSPAASARCAPQPAVLSKVTVYACQRVTVEASVSKTRVGDPPLYEHRPGDKISGVLLSARVDESELVWPAPPPHAGGSFARWEPGSFRSLFLEGDAEVICPPAVPTQKNVVTTDLCCDTLPHQSLCLLGNPIVVVRDEPNPARWYKHAPAR